MKLQEKLKLDLKNAIKEKDNSKKDAIRIIIGELARKSKKEFDDSEIISIIKKLVKSEKESLEQLFQLSTSEYMQILESYLPELVSNDVIIKWIEENIDFLKFKNKMQAMGLIMKNFGTSVDGNIVKNILLEHF